MTLIEVIIAIAIVGIVATAATGLAISSLTGSVTQKHRAVAVTVANDAMEQVTGLPAAMLYGGRSAADVAASYVANSSTSAATPLQPRMSMLSWKNSRRRPFWAFS